MKKGMRFAVCFLALGALAFSGASAAGEKGHGSMPGMSMKGKMEGHGMMKMGDKVFEGKVGPLHGEARLADMKAQMAKAKMSPQMMANMKNTHHLSLMLTDPKTKKAVTEGKGSVTVTGPDKKQAKTDFMVMQGHFGADVNLPAPGKYTFRVEVEAGGTKGSATFEHTVE
ncbi:MAG: hypothetical protein Kow00128_06780 [Deltaproteobacteria bacterium]